ncbi:cytochrome P450 [Dendrothele bispora CBS 962.96]|uniref:Cytochrome P450 n=1 Tax=Dendrothele bispora (strain CBS 962.96) TaxID=1314807 RepID=A0A4S8MY11_DENBC|nr:cytochrome P450 [Dendrothele bispora CBS 962.96]
MSASISETTRNVQPIIACILALVLYSALRWVNTRNKMPPGPLGIPFLGSRHQMPILKPWRKFTEWNKHYGSVVSLFLGSTPVIVLGSAQVAWDLLEKRSEIYSSRPRFVVAGEILSDNHRGLMLSNATSLWRKWRKILHNGFHVRKSENYKEIQSLESKVLLQQILTNPDDYEKHLQRFAASVVTSVTYGRRVDSVDEWIVKENMDSMACKLSIPGKYIVESWPWLLSLPRSWQWFRREPEERKKKDVHFLTYLLNDVRTRMNAGTSPDCLASQCLIDIDKIGMTELELAYSVSSPFGAGIETTAGTLVVFILAMLHYPSVMKKAQTELDSVVGHERLPEYEDRLNLPYINALVNETLRWRPVAILGGTPHAVTADDVYKGLQSCRYIPRGSTIFANFDRMMHEPEMFPEPETFRPERFLETDDPRLQTFDLPFGFGRRQCPGMHLALNSVFINISRLLWGFEITPKLDKEGNKILPDPSNFTNGFNSKPVSFECQIVPRNASVVRCIEAEYHEAKGKLSGWA